MRPSSPLPKARRWSSIGLAATLLAGLLAVFETTPASTQASEPSATVALLGCRTSSECSEEVSTMELTGVTAVTAVAGTQASVSSFALGGDGTVWGWGSRLGTDGNSSLPVQVEPLEGIAGLAGGASHALAVADDGTLWAWGGNGYGQLGDGSFGAGGECAGSGSKAAPQQVDLTGVISAAGGHVHSVALTEDATGQRTVWAWGQASNGQLGDGIATGTETCFGASATPKQVALPPATAPVKAVAAGGKRSLALLEDGTVYSWGFPGPPVPTPVEGFSSKVVAIAAGHAHNLAVLDNGEVWAWGDNRNGQLGTGVTSPTLPFAAGGSSPAPVPVQNPDDPGTRLTGIAAVAAGSSHSLALGADGKVWGWGAVGANKGQIGSDPSPSPVQIEFGGAVAAIAAGASQSLAVLVGVSTPTSTTTSTTAPTPTLPPSTVPSPTTSSTTTPTTVPPPGSGAVGALGCAYGHGPHDAGALCPDQPAAVEGLAGITAVAGGQESLHNSRRNHSVALGDDGTVWAWGDNARGQLSLPTSDPSSPTPVQADVPSATAVAAGAAHSLALAADGTVRAWGWNEYGQLGDGSAGCDNTADAVKPDPVEVKGLSSVTHVAAGRVHSVALDEQGKVWAWGQNHSGQLGNGFTAVRRLESCFDPGNVAGEGVDAPPGLSSVPQGVALPGPAVSVAAAGDHTVALLADGTVWSWGTDGTGAFPTPHPVGGFPATVKAIAAGGAQPPAVSRRAGHNLALLEDGTVWAWGDNANGQLGLGVSPPPTGDSADAAVVPPTQVPELSGITAIAAGSFHSLALDDDGDVWAWGAVRASDVCDSDSTLQVHYGQTGPVPSSRPVALDRDSFGGPVRALAGGAFHTLAVVDGEPPPRPGLSTASTTTTTAASPSSVGTTSTTSITTVTTSSTTTTTVPGEGQYAQDQPWEEEERVSTDPPHVTVSRPPYRTYPAFAYLPDPADPNAAKERVVMFGGVDEEGPAGCDPRSEARDTVFPGVANDTWTWDGTSWTEQKPQTSPQPRRGAAMAHDPVTRKLVLFGGVRPTYEDCGGDAATVKPDCVLGDTWTWDGSNWREEEPAVSPPPRVGAAMAEDSRGRVMLFGGSIKTDHGRADPEAAVADTWTWDGVNSTWVQEHPTARPSPRAHPAIAFHRASGRTVLFGGVGADDDRTWGNGETWTWDGAGWRQEDTRDGPPYGVAMAEHESTSDLVMGTWTWDGRGWTRRHPPGGAPSGSAMASHPPSNRVVLCCGFDSSKGGVTRQEAITYTWDATKKTSATDLTNRMTLSLDPDTIPADGMATSTATVTLTQGSRGAPGSRVDFSTDGDVSFGPVKDHGDGRYTTTVSSSYTPGEERITARSYFPYNTTATATLVETETSSGPCPPGAPDRHTDWRALDQGFGCQGKVLTPFKDANGEPVRAGGRDVAIQRVAGEDKMVVVGTHLLRYDIDGTLDPSFAAKPFDAAHLLVDADNKLLVAGGRKLSRFNSDGTLDDGGASDSTPGDSFGAGGTAELPFFIRGLDLQPDGKVVATGGSIEINDLSDLAGFLAGEATNTATNFELARLNSDGTPDTGFNRCGTPRVEPCGGHVVTRFAGTNSISAAVAVQGDGKIVVGGNTWSRPGLVSDATLNADFALARYHHDGKLDAGFLPCGSGGTEVCTSPTPVFRPPATQAGAQNVTILADGKILAGGFVFLEGTRSFALARFDGADGSPDPGFNACASAAERPCGGAVAAPGLPGWQARGNIAFGNDDWVFHQDMALQKDGRILMAGTGPFSFGDVIVARFRADGTFEDCHLPQFVRTRVRDHAGASAVAIQPDGKIVTAGSSQARGQPSEVTLVRYAGATNPDAPSRLCQGLAISDAAPVQVPDAGTTAARFTVRLDQGPDQGPVPGPPLPGGPVSVDYATDDVTATAGQDYTATSGTLVFAAGERAKIIEVPVRSSAVVNGSERFEVKLADPVNAPIARGTGEGTIVEPERRVGIGDQGVTEPASGAVPVEFNVTLSRPAPGPVSVDYATEDATATAGRDYVATSGRVEIPAGATAATVVVEVLGDTVAEPAEHFSVVLSDPVGATLGQDRARGEITDATAPGGLAVGDASVVEGDAGVRPASFTLRLDHPATEVVTVDYATENGTADAGEDYTAAVGSVRFEPGEQSHTVVVEVLADTRPEPDEWFTLSLHNPTGAALVEPRGRGTIVDDDELFDPTGPEAPPFPTPAPLALLPLVQPPGPARMLPPPLPAAPPTPVPQPVAPAPAGQPQLQAQPGTQPQPQLQPQPQAQAQAQTQAQAAAQQQAQAAAQGALMAERDRELQVERARIQPGHGTHLASARRHSLPAPAPVVGWVAALMVAGLGLAVRPGSARSAPARLDERARRPAPPRRGRRARPRPGRRPPQW